VPRSLVNKFTVLTIEDNNTIDSELVDALPSTPLVSAPLRKPKWEKRLPKLFSVSALDARGTSLLLPMEIGTTDMSELHSVKAFISKSLNKAERSYEIHDREMLSIIRCLDK